MYKILFRRDRDNEEEYIEAKKIFDADLITSRCDIESNTTVIGRYSVLPFYKELCDDLSFKESKLINSYTQHNYIADMWEWYQDLKDFTPKTWENMESVPLNEDGPFVLKGATNSKKFQWNTHMFAANRKDAINVMCRLYDDGLISTQRIYVRKFVPLMEFYPSRYNAPPVSKEFRFFVFNGSIIYSKFYWASSGAEIEEETGKYPQPNEVPLEFINGIINIIGNKSNFYVIDVALTKDHRWIVIELNDGQMSGLSANDKYDAEIFYRNLKLAF